MRYVIDTEFAERPHTNESPPTIELISIGIAAEDGRTLYAENAEFSGICSDWVAANVLPKLTGNGSSREDIATEIRCFVGDDPYPEFWAYFASYDWVVFCWLFGTMLDLPAGWPMHVMDIKQRFIATGSPAGVKPPDPVQEHNAVTDAVWGLEFLRAIDAHHLKNCSM